MPPLQPPLSPSPLSLHASGSEGREKTGQKRQATEEMSCLRLPHTSPHVSLKECSHCLPIHYLSLSVNWTRAKSWCFLCMLAAHLQGNRYRRLQCTSPDVITALIKTITEAHSFPSYGGHTLASSAISLHLDVHFPPLSPEPER